MRRRTPGGHDDSVAHVDRAHRRPDLADLGDDLVAERDGQGQNVEHAGDERAVEVADRHGDRAHDGGLRAGQDRLRYFLPLDLADVDEGQPSHRDRPPTAHRPWPRRPPAARRAAVRRPRAARGPRAPAATRRRSSGTSRTGSPSEPEITAPSMCIIALHPGAMSRGWRDAAPRTRLVPHRRGGPRCTCRSVEGVGRHARLAPG
jgi:hypothetical protein